jgi:hypothetical protein
MYHSDGLDSAKPVCTFTHDVFRCEISMTPTTFSSRCIALLVLAAATFSAAPASARSNYDGSWSVLIVTDNGQCDRAYRYGISIRNGTVVYEGSAPVNVAGQVTGNGAVRVRVWNGSQHANGNGRLSRSGGGGTWAGSGTSGACSGTWTAERR